MANGIQDFVEAIADDLNPALELKKVLVLKAKVDRLTARHEIAKRELKDIDEYKDVKSLAEELKGATAELNEMLAELGREYPLFKRKITT
jgi:hypothetical protein